MKRRMFSVLMLCMALFAILPLTSASAAYSTKVTGQGQLVISASFTAGNPSQGAPTEANVYITNQNGQAVYNRLFGGTNGKGTINASVPNLPYGTYNVTIGGPQLTLSNLQISFK